MTRLSVRNSKMSRADKIAAKKAILRANKNQQSAGYDSPWGRDLKMFKPNNGKNTLRILPFPGNDHYAKSVQMHWGVGPDNGAYLCLDHNDDDIVGADSVCPICIEYKRLQRETNMMPEGDAKDAAKKAANKVKAKERRLVLLIDRDSENEGIQFWAMPFSIDSNLIELAEDDDSGECLIIDDVDEGHDISFRKEGVGLATEYSAYQIKPKPTPLSTSEDRMDKWCDELDNLDPLSLTNAYSAEHIAKVYGMDPEQFATTESAVVSDMVETASDTRVEAAVSDSTEDDSEGDDDAIFGADELGEDL